MKKLFLILPFLLLAAVLCGCAQEKSAPFRAEDTESLTVYRYAGAPSGAEKKTITGPDEIDAFCEHLFSLGSPVSGEALAGGGVISFRALLSDGTVYEAIYTDPGQFKALDAVWNTLPCEASPAGEDELPVLSAGSGR